MSEYQPNIEGVLQAADKAVREAKELYLQKNCLMGYNWATWNWLIGARGRGKSFMSLDIILDAIDHYGQENVKVYYFRISDLSCKAMLENKGRKAIDALLIRKHNLELTTKGYTLYNKGKPMIDFYPLVSAAKKGKGVAEYDPDFLLKRPEGVKRFIYVIVDEFMMAEGLEKKSVGNPVAQFLMYLENILRDQEQLDYCAVKIFGCANAVSECSDFLAQLCGFIPEPNDFGIKKLKRKHTIIWNIPNTEAYLNKRKKSILGDVIDMENDSNYTNVVKKDLDTLMKKGRRLYKITMIIKFHKDPKFWFAVWDGRYIRRYKNETFNKNLILPMTRHLDGVYCTENVNDIIARYDARAFYYADMISQATFAAAIKELKTK